MSKCSIPRHYYGAPSLDPRLCTAQEDFYSIAECYWIQANLSPALTHCCGPATGSHSLPFQQQKNTNFLNF